jgi:hypothetical protein
VAGACTFSARFNKVAAGEAEPGHEYVRYNQMQTAFTLSAIMGCVFAVAAGVLASLWGGTVQENSKFMAPFVLGWIAA